MSRVKKVTGKAGEQLAGGKAKTVAVAKNNKKQKKAPSTKKGNKKASMEQCSSVEDEFDGGDENLFSDLDQEMDLDQEDISLPALSPQPETATQAQNLQEEQVDEQQRSEEKSSDVEDLDEQSRVVEPDPIYLALEGFSMKKVLNDLHLISMTLEHNLCLKAALVKTERLTESLQHIPFFNALDDYLKVWEFREVLRFFIEKKLQSLNDSKPSIGQKRPAWLK